MKSNTIRLCCHKTSSFVKMTGGSTQSSPEWPTIQQCVTSRRKDCTNTK